MNWHIAQLNVGRVVAPTDSPALVDFMAALDGVNALADAAPGFVWRLKSDSGNATDILVSADIFDLDERLKALEGAHGVDVGATRGKTILLFDDLYRSGATMNAITTMLYEQGQAADVFALTVTRTRSHQ